MQGAERRQLIYDFVADYYYQYGIWPSVREIEAAVGLHTPSAVTHHTDLLVRLGLMDQIPGTPRGLSLHGGRLYPVPLVGTIAAGKPLRLPETHFWLTEHPPVFVPAERISPDAQHFALKVKGMSMIDALVKDGDTVVLRRQDTADIGQMVAALLIEENETTLKYYYPEEPQNRVRLQPAHPHMAPIYVRPDNLLIQGRVVWVMRDV